ncbi:MAG: prolyl oligopeptidase family serine peptidase [Blastocatellia bacterium]|nr:prolyl oligopeptidase family serine peptidase [Blastocatellia bacterium]
MNDFKALCKRSAFFFLIAVLAAGQFAQATAAQKPSSKPSESAAKRFDLTIDNIMRGTELTGYGPRAVRWAADSQRIYFQWKQANEPRDADFDTYTVNRDGTGLRKLSEQEAENAPPTGGEQSKDKKLTLFGDEGDLFLYDHAAGRRRQITSTTDRESNPRFTKDQRRIYFTNSNNLFMMSLDSGSITQMTDIRMPGGGAQAERRGEERRGTESQEYLKKEERELIEAVKRRAERRQQDEEKRKRENPRKPFQLKPRQRVASLQLSPDEKYVIASVVEQEEGAKNTVVPNYVTESSYAEEIPSRTKVGDSQSKSRIAILNVETGEAKWVDHGQKEAGEQGSRGAASLMQGSKGAEEQGSRGDMKPAPQQVFSSAPRQESGPRERDVQLFPPVWSEDGTKAVMQARASDNKDRWILALDPSTGKTRPLFSEHDDSWIGRLGAFTFGWMKDDRHIYFQSERDGYAHLYALSYDGGQPRPLTSGKWEVTGVELSDDKSRFFLTTSEVHPGERHFYVMSAEGGERVKVTSAAGSHEATVSPDEKSLAIVYSYSNRPPELYIQDNRPGAAPVKVTSSPAPEFWNYEWTEPPIINFKARDGVMVPARLYKPKNFKRGGPAVIFVHGAGYLQNVHRWWSSYFREYMFHHFLMENGYVVMDVDYRASAGYGRDWRTGIYRHMGGKDLEDQVDAARWLAREHGVDAKRIGIYGGSYGGFITLMAMFTQPEVFAAGASLRPVTDWAHYNHPYTSNILNVPQEDAEAYKRSSPIYFAEGLKGALLICHGMVDTNVHFQDTVRLAQRLIELRKENWEVAVYPVENHGFVEPTSWADEYKRIFKLFETNLKKGMPTAR